MRACLSRAIAATLIAVAAGLNAAPLQPASDNEVVERLPGGGARAEERAMRQRLAQAPTDAALAVQLAQKDLERARSQGDPRYAGLALAALGAWKNDAAPPPEVALMQATLKQYLHDFEGAATQLEALVARAPTLAQAWLTLATVRRVQGRYDASDAACRGLANAATGVHAQACLAENDGLRGRFDAASGTLKRLAATPRLDAGTRGWLLTTLAETEERAGRADVAEVHWREALKADPNPYTTLAYADFLLLRGRDADVLRVLAGQPRSDAVLLRLAIAGARSGHADGAAHVQEMRERIALANLRPETSTFHGREQAMFSLFVEKDARRALELARVNVALQREPIDLLLYAQCAQAAGDADAQRAVQAIVREVGLVDARLRVAG